MIFRHPSWSLIRTAVFLPTLALLNSPAAELVAHWINPSNGLWFDVANWDTPLWPDNSGTDVYDVQWVEHPVNVELNRTVPVEIRNFEFSSGGTLAGSVNLLITGTLDWSNGTMAGPDAVARSTIVDNGSVLGTAAPGQRITLKNRVLYPGTVSILFSPIYLETVGTPPFPSGIDIREGKEFRMEEGAEVRISPAKTGGTIANSGTLQMVTSPVPFVCEAPISSRGRVLVDDRTVNFAPGTGLTLDGLEATLVMNGGRIPATGPDSAGEVGGLVAIPRQGRITGNGEIGSAQIGYNPGVSATAQTWLSGHLDFGELTLEPTAIYQVSILSRDPGSWDQHRVQRKLRLGGILEVSVPEEVAAVLLPTDRFEILTPAAGCDVSGDFSNARIGQRVPTVDGKATFLLDYAAPGSKALVLRDFQGMPFRLTGFGGGLDYGVFGRNSLGLDQDGPVALAGEAVLTTVTPVFPFGGGRLLFEIIDGFDPAQDQLTVRPGMFSLEGNRVKTISENRDIGSWTAVGSQLIFDFNANARAELVEALLRRVIYFNPQFHTGVFVTGTERFSPRTVRITLSDSTGHRVSADSQINFPYLRGIRFPLRAGFITARAMDFRLLGDFSNGFSYGLPALNLVVGPTNLPPFPHAELNPNDHSIVRVFYPDYERGFEFSVTANVGQFAAVLCLKGRAVDGCLLSAFDLSFSSCVPSPSVIRGGNRAAQGPPTISLPLFHAIESVMGRTPGGERLAALYREHSPELIRIISLNTALIEKVAAAIAQFQPGLEAFVAGSGQSFQISTQMLASLNAAWDAVATYASPALKNAMTIERDRFNGLQKFAQKNFSEWADLLEIERQAVPFIHIADLRLVGKETHFTSNRVPGKTLTLWRSSNLANWEAVPGFRSETDSYSVSLVDPARAAEKAFYQIRAE